MLSVAACDFQCVFRVQVPDPAVESEGVFVGRLLGQPREGQSLLGSLIPHSEGGLKSFRSGAVRAAAKRTWNRWASWPHEKQGFEVLKNKQMMSFWE